MAAPDPRTIRNVIGRLIKDPTDLTLTDGIFGGTQLGLVKQKVIRVVTRTKVIRAQEFGSIPVETIRGAHEIALLCELRGWDSDAISAIFPDVTTATASGRPRINFPGSTRAGAKGTDDAFSLLFAPRNTEEHPALILYKAIPMLAESMELRMGRQELSMPVVFMATRDPDSPAKMAEMGLLTDLDVT